MRWYNNLKISVKLLTGFFLVALIAGAVGIVGITNIRTTDTRYTELFEQYGIALGYIGDVSTDFQITRNLVKEIIIDNNAANVSKNENKIKEYDREINENLDLFQKSMATEEAKKEFNSLKASLDKYNPIRDRVVSLAVSNQKDKATELMNSEAIKAADDIDQSIGRLEELKKTVGRQRSDELTQLTNSTVITMVIIVLIAMIAAAVLGVFISRSISNPVNELIKVAGRIADGDLNVDIEVLTEDEVGKLQGAFKRMAENTNDVISNINYAAEQVSAGAKQVSDSSIALSQGATEQASSIEELTASIEEISVQTKQNAEFADQANNLAETAKTNAEQGNDQMKGMLNAMDEINEASGSISKIIKVIDEIAFQTNILALNAAVEAARAGQHGKGFAVVAEEVRNLAARSANAAKETTDMIEGSIKKAEGGTKIANETAAALNKIVEDVTKAAALVKNIAVASNEQAAGIAQITQGLAQVSEVVQTNSATSEESAAASEELSSQAGVLKEQVSRFKIKRNNSYKTMNDLNPEVLKILKDMTNKKKVTEDINDHKTAASPAKSKIALSDNEFGKY